jgi:transcriptional regulator with XRE-family HTH domain
MDDSQMRLNFRRRLQTIMNRKWVTQEELAQRINSSQQMISRYLTGQSIPSALTIKKIADALDCNVNDFYDYFL